MKRVTGLLALAVLLWSTAAMAVNTVVVPSLSVAKGATGVVIPITIANTDQLRGIVAPFVFRE